MFSKASMDAYKEKTSFGNDIFKRSRGKVTGYKELSQIREEHRRGANSQL
jgi:hypothetical protein